LTTDTTFITNEAGKTLRDRFQVLIKDTRLFDVLVGYFYTSGFHAIYKSLENTEHIRILVGIGTGKETIDLLRQARETQSTFDFSHAEVSEQFADAVNAEMEHSEDTQLVEEGVHKFVEWLHNGKLEIKAYPSAKIHAKLYIMTFVEGDKDIGRVITGSSNFTQAGWLDNLEFNVELKDKADYDFALAKFNELWTDAVDLKDKYLDTVTKTWINTSITPYELYLKFLYEYFKDQINKDQETIENEEFPDNFLKLQYQLEAVKDAQAKLEAYGGVFISDVVGLGKTYIAAMLANQLKGRNLVIAPPVLLDRDSPGSWPNVFEDFRVRATRFESLGKLDTLIAQGVDKYDYVFIDEAHRFRTETTISYEKLAQICRGKKVILITATPLNNSPADILSQIKLFQKARKSTIPNLPDLETFFNGLTRKLEDLDRQNDFDKYIAIVRENARQIREKVLQYIMVRRTRSEIIKYFTDDLKQEGMKFPEVADPAPFYYQMDKNEDAVFNRTIKLAAGDFQYSRYTPMLYFQGEITQPEDLAQKNMRKFMKILLVKRLESSFYAFRHTLSRFIKSYRQFLAEFDKGHVYISKKYANKLFEFLENDDDAAVQRLIDEDRVHHYDAADFKPEFRLRLQNDLDVLLEMDRLWQTVHRDPKLISFLEDLKTQKILKTNKLIIFTESRETAEYLDANLNKVYHGKVLLYHGGSEASIREQVIRNFDARARHPSDEYRILITTEVLAEGVNLHRSNVVINYDIPWNPTRLMQRVGRINRVDTKFDTIYTYNFFPTTQSNDEIKLKEAAIYKIQAFIEMLGADARLLTEGEEIKSHDLYTRLTSKETITGEDETEDSELKYLKIIRDIRDKDTELFTRIKHLPKKARTGRKGDGPTDSLITYFRKNKLHKFFRTTPLVPSPSPVQNKAEEMGENQHPLLVPSPLMGEGQGEGERHKTEELDFITAAKIIEAEPDTLRRNPAADYYKLLSQNKAAFFQATSEEVLPEMKMKGGRDAATFLLKILKAIRKFEGFTDDDEDYLKRLTRLIEEGGLPRQTLNNIQRDLKNESRPLRILGKLRTNIAAEFFKETAAEKTAPDTGPREVILSEYLAGD
jgi:superfamily II DNA or RNA helicase